MTELTVRDVHKYLGGLHILQGASFTAERGSIVSLLGASGSGKQPCCAALPGWNNPNRVSSASAASRCSTAARA